jgi:2-oxoglutarate ferredoxin oxidoreductase subunit gamma
MKQEFRIAGIGGQGIILLGTILARAFALYENLHTVQTTFYSAAYRGGLSSTDIIVTDEELYDLTVQTPTYLLLTAKRAFSANTGLFNTAHYIIIDKHNIIIDEEFHHHYQTKSFLADFYTLAKEQHLKSRSTNMIMLGIIGKKSGVVSRESLVHALHDVVKKDIDDNIKAVTVGYSLV